MANSRKSNSTDLAGQVATRVASLVPVNSSIVVGLSGGLDSVVLLHLLHGLAVHHSWRLSALHVHHGISPHAGDWASFCSGLCDRHDIPVRIEHVDIRPLRHMGIEAAARKLRHEALARQPVDFIALAHHRDDQVETMLLQLLRGAGVKGASAMALMAVKPEMPTLIRPLLHCTRRQILDYANEHRLEWVEDESNADGRYPRNFLRHRVMPVLNEGFPLAGETLARSAGHFAEASGLLDDLARIDCMHAMAGHTLDVQALQSLSPARARNLLRYFIHVAGAPMPQAVQLEDMIHQLIDASRDAVVCVTFGGWEVRRFAGKVYVMRSLEAFDKNLVLPWQGEPELYWPALASRLCFKQNGGPSENESASVVSMARLGQNRVTLKLRQGGEALRSHPGSMSRALKNLLQEHHVPPWQRDRLPLVYCNEELICVPGIAVASGYLPANLEDRMEISIRSAE